MLPVKDVTLITDTRRSQANVAKAMSPRVLLLVFCSLRLCGFA
jgi:hypothetical protein